MGIITRKFANNIGSDGVLKNEGWNDNKIINDLSTLALRQASDADKVVYSTSSAHVDVFQDASGITNLTNATRNASEYVDSTGTTVTTPTRTHDADTSGTDGDYSWFRWTGVGTGTYSADANETAELLIIAGGGGGGTGGGEGGGGGAGGLVYYGSETPKTPNGAAVTLSSGATYTATVGGGGSGATTYGAFGGNGTSGGNSSFTGSGLSLTTALGGGTGGTYPSNGANHGTGVAGGSGGGGGGNSSGGGDQTGGAGTSGQGFAGGNGVWSSSPQWYLGGGGGGASEAGETPGGSKAGDGGDGLAYSITGSSVTYAGGGGANSAGSDSTGGGLGGAGGGGNNSANGTDGLGGGGGGSSGNGGSGTVILRVPTSASVSGIQSTGSFESTSISVSESVSSMGAIITYQNQAGTNTLNTDIVLKLSADGGSNYSTATLVAMPDFSNGIKMAKVNDLSVTAGTSLKYKIEFANQSASSKEARIRGVSLQY